MNDDAASRQAITDVIHRYCRSMDRIDAELGYGVWHEGGTADYGPVFQGTGRGFIDWVCEFHRTLDSHHHQVGNILIDLRGNEAGSETYITVNLLAKEEADGKRTIRTGRGRYLDRWSRRDGRWAIDHRHFILDFVVTHGVDVVTGWSHRDSNDPSYGVLAAQGAA